MGGLQAVHLRGYVEGESENKDEIRRIEEVTLGPWGSSYPGPPSDVEVYLEGKKAKFYWSHGSGTIHKGAHPSTRRW